MIHYEEIIELSRQLESIANGMANMVEYGAYGRDAIISTATISITKYYPNTPFNHPGTSTPFSFISSKHLFPFSVSTKYIWRLSCSPSLRVSRSLDSTERMVFEACEGVMPVLEVMSPAETVSLPTLQRTIASFRVMP